MEFPRLEDFGRRGLFVERALARRPWLALIAVLGVAILFRLWIVESVDFRGAPGAGATQRLSLVSAGDRSHWDTRLVSSVLPACSDDVLCAARVVGIGGGALAALGVLLGAWSIGGAAAGLVGGLMAALWARGVFISVTYGMEGPAWGIAWLGVGLAWCGGATRRWWGVLLAILGSVLVVGGAAVKGTALPALGFLAVAPFLVRENRLKFVATVLGMLGAVWWAQTQVFSQSVPPLPSGNLEISISAVLDGLRYLSQQPASKPLGWLPELAAVALFGALVPGRFWIARVITGLVSIAVMGLTVNHLMTGDHLGPMLRMRYLVPPVFGALALAGCAVGWIARRWANVLDVILRRREPGRSFPVGWLSAVLHGLVFVLFLGPPWVGFLDALSLMRAWSGLRVVHDGALPAALPVPPAEWEERYASLGSGAFFNTSAIGGIELFEIGLSAGAAGVATLPLRDEREGHLVLAATLNRTPSWILHPRHCCEGSEASASCAASVVAAVDASGVLLALPQVGFDAQGRVDGRLMSWTRWLIAAAESRGELDQTSRWWATFQGRGSTPTDICGWSAEQRTPQGR
ncbi:MAG: hypothetical protein VX519_05595 [Myxococcota bacterium]|nr:hypothetical protein [Myxococcota bacterium]